MPSCPFCFLYPTSKNPVCSLLDGLSQDLLVTVDCPHLRPTGKVRAWLDESFRERVGSSCPSPILLLMLEVTVDLEIGREEGREVIINLALKKGLAEGTLRGPGLGSQHDESSGHLEPVGAAGSGQQR